MTALTSTDIGTRVKRIFGDTANVQINDSDIVMWINDAMREIVMQHEGLFQTTSTLPSVAGTNQYTLPTDLLSLQEIAYRDGVSGAYYGLRFLSAEGLDQATPDWTDTTSTGTPAYYARGDSGKFFIVPTPDTSVANGIQITYSKYATDISGLTSTALPFPEYYHQTILEYCLMKAYEMDENWEATDRKSQYVQSTIDYNNGREGWFGHETYPVITTVGDDQ
jgi:hypothetical protein